MKTNLFYFSATGNSLVVAKDIAAKLPNTQIFSIPQVINQRIDLNAEIIGIIYPVYYGGMPRIIIDFINRLEPGNIKYLFAVCTCGAFPAGSLLQTQKLLRLKNIALNAGFSIQMPGNYLVRYGAIAGKKQKDQFAKAKMKIDVIVSIIQNQQNNKIEASNHLFNMLAESMYHSSFPKFPTLDRNFTIDERCNSCQVCEKVCPVQNIKMVDNRPTWQGNCEHCLACIQWCPAKAIQYGKQTTNRKRYHHPEIKVKELYR